MSTSVQQQVVQAKASETTSKYQNTFIVFGVIIIFVSVMLLPGTLSFFIIAALDEFGRMANVVSGITLTMLVVLSLIGGAIMTDIGRKMANV